MPRSSDLSAEALEPEVETRRSGSDRRTSQDRRRSVKPLVARIYRQFDRREHHRRTELATEQLDPLDQDTQKAGRRGSIRSTGNALTNWLRQLSRPLKSIGRSDTRRPDPSP